MIAMRIAVILLLAAGSARAADHAVSFAIVVGNNRPEARSGNGHLHYADDDALSIDRLLRDAGATTVLLMRPDSDTRRLNPDLQPDGLPTAVAVRQAMASLREAMLAAQRRGRRTELLLFFSGHGDVAHGEGYLVLEQGRLTREMLYKEILARSPAQTNHVIVDACKSYFLAFDKGSGGTRIPYRRRFAERFAPSLREDTGFVLSTSSDRDSHEWERFQAGVFSHEVHSALRGAADADADGRVTYGELGAFLATANQAIANPRFRPDFVVVPPGARPARLDRPVLVWRSDDTFVVDRPELGHLYLEDAQGDRLIDLHGETGHELRLHLPVARPLFLRTIAGDREWVLPHREARTLSALDRRPVTVAAKGAIHLAFNKLFAFPFGPARVVGFRERYRERFRLEQARAQQDRRRELAAWPKVKRVVPQVTLWTGIASAVVGAGLQLWALERRTQGDDASQVRRAELNETIGTLDSAAWGLYGVAAAMGITSLVTYLLGWHQVLETSSISPSLLPVGRGLAVGSQPRL
jgi:hypothetical protein